MRRPSLHPRPLEPLLLARMPSAENHPAAPDVPPSPPRSAPNHPVRPTSRACSGTLSRPATGSPSSPAASSRFGVTHPTTGNNSATSRATPSASSSSAPELAQHHRIQHHPFPRNSRPPQKRSHHPYHFSGSQHPNFDPGNLRLLPQAVQHFPQKYPPNRFYTPHPPPGLNGQSRYRRHCGNPMILKHLQIRRHPRARRRIKTRNRECHCSYWQLSQVLDNINLGAQESYPLKCQPA